MEKAGEEAQGSVMASDAFFPFSWNDGVELACRSGVKAIAHPGGSIRDQVSTFVLTKCDASPSHGMTEWSWHADQV